MPKKKISTREAGINKLFKLGLVNKQADQLSERTQRKIVSKYRDVISGKKRVVFISDAQRAGVKSSGKDVTSNRGAVARNAVILGKGEGITKAGTLYKQTAAGRTTYNSVVVDNANLTGNYQAQIVAIGNTLKPNEYLSVALPGGVAGSAMVFDRTRISDLLQLIYDYVQRKIINIGDVIFILTLTAKAAKSVVSSPSGVGSNLSPIYKSRKSQTNSWKNRVNNKGTP